MSIRQHDGADAFLFVVTGELSGASVQQLEWSCETAKSILRGKELIVDISGVTDADESGSALLLRMRESGARLTATSPPASEDFVRSFGAPGAAAKASRTRAWALRRLAQLRSV